MSFDPFAPHPSEKQVSKPNYDIDLTAILNSGTSGFSTSSTPNPSTSFASFPTNLDHSAPVGSGASTGPTSRFSQNSNQGDFPAFAAFETPPTTGSARGTRGRRNQENNNNNNASPITPRQNDTTSSSGGTKAMPSISSLQNQMPTAESLLNNTSTFPTSNTSNPSFNIQSPSFTSTGTQKHGGATFPTFPDQNYTAISSEKKSEPLRKDHFDFSKFREEKTSGSASTQVASMPKFDAFPTFTPEPVKAAPTMTPEQAKSVFGKAVSSMTKCYEHLEKGSFSESLDAIRQTISDLVTLRSVQDVKKEVQLSVYYHLLLRILLEIKKSEKNLIKSAHFARVLADVPVKAKHRAVCVRMAITKNLQIKNYGVAAKYIKMILPFQLPDKDALQQKLKLCEQENLTNTNLPDYSCPNCNGNSSAAEDKCQQCNVSILFCHYSFTAITSKSFLKCDFCPTLYANRHGDIHQTCPVCRSGQFEPEYFPKHKPSASAMPNFGNFSSNSQKNDLSDSHERELPPRPSKKEGKQSSTASPVPQEMPSLTAPSTVTNPPVVPSQKGETKREEQSGSEKSKARRPPPSEPIPEHIQQKYKKDQPPKEEDVAVPKKEATKVSRPKKEEKKESLFPNPFATLRGNNLPISEPKFLRHEKPDFSPFARMNINFMTEPQREAYQRDFEKADRDGDGFVGPQDAKVYFNQFGIERKKLSVIWALADVGQDGQLDLPEFEIAMHLIRCAQVGIEMPEELPEDLVPWEPPSLPKSPSVKAEEATVKVPELPKTAPELPKRPHQSQPPASPEPLSPKSDLTSPRELQRPTKAAPSAPSKPAPAPPAELTQSSTQPRKPPPPVPTNSNPRGKAPPPVPKGHAPPVPRRDPARPPPESFAYLRKGGQASKTTARSMKAAQSLSDFNSKASEDVSVFSQFPSSIVNQRTESEEDYISSLPPKISKAAQFVRLLCKEGLTREAYNLCSGTFQQRMSLQSLETLAAYYLKIDFLWFCEAFAFRKASSSIILFVPLYIPGGNHQAKVWIEKEGITGVEFNSLNRVTWESGEPERYIIAPPRRITTSTGQVLEIYTSKHEEDAINNPDVPLRLRTCRSKIWKFQLSQNVTINDKVPTLLRKGKDQKSYHVFSEINTNEHTLNINQSGYIREFWVPKDNVQLPMCFIRDRSGELCEEEPFLETISGQLESYSAHRNSKKKSEIVQKPIPDIRYYYFAWPAPIETTSSSLFGGSIKDNPQGFLSQDKIAYISKVDSTQKQISLSVEWKSKLRGVELCPIYDGENYVEPTPLTLEQEISCLADTKWIGFLDKDFVNLLLDRGWTKKRDESLYALAKRTFIGLCQSINLSKDDNLHKKNNNLTEIFKSGTTDRYTASRLYVAILRANKIPARIIFGRDCQRAIRNDILENTHSLPLVEFFHSDSESWVPCDVAKFAGNKDATIILAGFARVSSAFFPWSEDKPVVQLPILGPRQLTPADVTHLFDHKVNNSVWDATLLD